MMQNRVNEKQELLNLIKYFFTSNPDSTMLIDCKSKENTNNNEYDEIKLAILSSLENFLRCSEIYELNFPMSFSSDEQLLVQIAADKIGLKSQIIKKSKTQSVIIVYKDTVRSYFHEPMTFNITWNSRRTVLQFITANPFTIKEKQDINHKPDKDGREDRHRGTTGKLMDAVPQVPLIKTIDGNSVMSPESIFSPIWSSKTEIIEAIKQNPIVIISSASGCGKTTQIGQIIMQECAKASEPCRMICTQPYRLTAHAYAQYVTQQRKENIGQTVGYQIRLESKVSPRTLLTFCTNEVLLRTLYGDRAFLNGTTHIIVDEVQERCKHSDLLLCVLNKMQKIHRHIKIIILISTPIIPHDIIQSSSPRTKNSYYNRQCNIANANASKEKQNYFVNIIRQYFEFCPTVYVRKPAQDIEELFLEDILNIVDCKFYNLEKYKTPYKVDLFKLTFEKWFSYWMSKQKTNENMDLNLFEMFYKNMNSNLYAENLMNYELSSVPNIGMMPNPFNNTAGNMNFNNQIDYVSLYDETLWIIWSRSDIEDIPMNFNFDLENFDVSKLGNFYMSSTKNESGIVGNNYFKFLFSIIINRFVSVNHQHRMSALTALMICAFRGMKNAVIRLLSLGADATIPLIVTENMYQAHILYIRHLRTTHQLNKNIEFYNQVLAAYQNRYSIHNILYASDLGLITRNFEIADFIFIKITCISENMNLRNVTINYNESTNCKQIPFVEDTDFMYSLIKGLLKTIDKNTNTGTILIFLPDYNHLVQLKTILLASNEEIFDKITKYQIYLLHSWMMIQDLNSLLSNVSSNCRKIILSTCIGESSLNINDISFVIDTGIETKKVYDEILNITTLKTVYISKAQAAYRASRATNSINRFCFHIYSSAQYQAFEDNKVAEILTHPLNEVVLQMKLLTAIGASVNQFLGSLMDTPTPESSKSSIMLLKSIGALDSFEDITELGYHLYDLPLDPKYGKMVLMSVLLKCLDPILTISCILNLQDPFLEVSTDLKYRELIEIKKKFASNTFSDHMVLLRVFQFWQKSRAEGWENTFCQKNYLSTAVFDIITGIRTQLLGQLRASGFVKARGNGDIRDLNYNSENWAIVKAALVSGLPNKYLFYNPSHAMLVGSMNAKVVPHPTSTLYNCESSSFLTHCNYSTNVFIYDKSITSSNVSNTKWNEYNCLMTNNKIVQAKCMTMVTAATVALLGANVDIVHSEPDNKDSNRDKFSIGFDNSNQDDGHIYFKADEELCQLILKLRQKWQFTVMRKLKNPSKQSTPQDEAILRTIVNVLTLEEQSYGLKQPYGVGARPRPMAPEYCNQNDSCTEFSKQNSLNDSPGTEYVRNNLINDKRGLIIQCENKILPSEPIKTQGTDFKDTYNSSVIPLDKSRMLNSGTNHFFIIKLLHESEMSGIMISQVYKVNTSLKLQIEHLLFKGFTIYFIFINSSNSVLLGYARILQVIYPEAVDLKQTSSATDNSEYNLNRNQTFSLSLDVYPGKLDEIYRFPPMLHLIIERIIRNAILTPGYLNTPPIVDVASLSNTSSELENIGKQYGILEDNQKSVIGENINKVFIPQYLQNTKLFN